jgi:hypothetical protein
MNLDRKTVLFVGGLKQQVPHMRRYVEDHNGNLTHHDGGMEDNMGRLAKLFSRADLVLFPVDCVSHAAQTEVKKLCRRDGKPYLPMPSASISVFKQALSAMLAGADVPAGMALPIEAAWPTKGPSRDSRSAL